MKILIGLILILLNISSYCYTLNVSQCHAIEKPIKDLEQKVQIGNCKKVPCRLRRNSEITMTLKITPDRDVEKITNSIYAYIAGVPFPFVGHDQTDACPLIYSADGKEKVGCPLKGGQNYIYKETLEVLQIYPRLKLVIHWGITADDGKDIICFEIPARITN